MPLFASASQICFQPLPGNASGDASFSFNGRTRSPHCAFPPATPGAFGIGQPAIRIKHALLRGMPRDLRRAELVLDGRKVLLARFKAPRHL